MNEGEVPHIVLEVIYTNPILDKLHVYSGLAVPEVWLWKEGAFELYRLGSKGSYTGIERSTFLPDLDFAMLAGFASRDDQDNALREFADALQAETRR
jgi:hypothetical protein